MKVNLAHTFMRLSRTLISQLSQNTCYVMAVMLKKIVIIITTIIIYINVDFLYIIIFTYNLRVLPLPHMKLSAYKQHSMCSLYVGMCFEDTYYHTISGFSINES